MNIQPISSNPGFRRAFKLFSKAPDETGFCEKANVCKQAELTMDEMLLDPIVRIVMRYDNVSECDIRQVIGEAEERFASKD